jgi:hypothetical protein
MNENLEINENIKTGIKWIQDDQNRRIEQNKQIYERKTISPLGESLI